MTSKLGSRRIKRFHWVSCSFYALYDSLAYCILEHPRKTCHRGKIPLSATAKKRSIFLLCPSIENDIKTPQSIPAGAFLQLREQRCLSDVDWRVVGSER